MDEFVNRLAYALLRVEVFFMHTDYVFIGNRIQAADYTLPVISELRLLDDCQTESVGVFFDFQSITSHHCPFIGILGISVQNLLHLLWTSSIEDWG